MQSEYSEWPETGQGVESVERQMRIHKLKQEAVELGADVAGGVESDCPPEIEEQFWRYLIDFEKAPTTTHARQLQTDGVALPAPATLDDADLALKLWQVIDALARRGVFLECTDHLSDRELYDFLWREGLRAAVADLPPDPAAAWHLDPLGSGSEEDTFLYLKYFAEEESRAHWQEQFPDYAMPPREAPPHDRDRHLPRRRWGGGEEK
jgi:hypothetical protein